MNYFIFPSFIIGIFGLAFGSFFNVCIHRIPRNESILPASHCPFCNRKINWWQNIPILSFLLLGGKCYSCKHPISWRYVAVELSTALIFILIYLHTGYQINGVFIKLVTFYSVGIIIFFIDWNHLIIPDSLNIILFITGLLFAFFPSTFIDWKASLIGAISGFCIFLLVAYFGSKIMKKDCLGGGDIKLIAGIGAYVGFFGMLITLFLASILAILTLILFRYDLKKQFPFGPFLISAAFIYQLWGDNLVAAYLQWWNL